MSACDDSASPAGPAVEESKPHAASTVGLHPYAGLGGGSGADDTAASGSVDGEAALSAVDSRAASLTALNTAEARPRVLLLEDARATAGSAALANALNASGFDVVRIVPEYAWNGTNPSLTDFVAVVHLDGDSYGQPLSTSAQQALTNFVVAGGGYVAGQWVGFERVIGTMTAMPDLILLSHGGPGNCGHCTVTYTLAASHLATHPVLEGVPATFTFFADGHDDAVSGFFSNPPMVLMQTGTGGAGVLVREFGAGRVVNFSVAPGYANTCQSFQPCVLRDASVVRQLYVNAVKWASQNANVDTEAPTLTIAGPLNGYEGSEMTFGFFATDRQSEIVSYGWDFGDGTSGSGTEWKISHTYADNGYYQMTITATDAAGNVGSASAMVQVDNVAPTVITGPDVQVLRGNTVPLVAAFADAGVNDGPWTYSVIWSGAGGVEQDHGPMDSQGNLPALERSYALPGTFHVLVTVTDKDGDPGQASFRVTVTNHPPIADAGKALAGPEGRNIQFDGSASYDPEGDGLTYAWDFGDGTTGSGPQPTHQYADNGSYAVTLTVTDEFEASSVANVQVEVRNVAPTASSFNFPSKTPEGTTFKLSFSGVSDAPGDLSSLTYRFDCGYGYGAPSAMGAAMCDAADDAALAVRAKITDKDGGESEYVGMVNVANVAPTIVSAKFPAQLTLANGRATGTVANVLVKDPGLLDAHVVSVDCGNGTAANAALECTYTDVGTYTLTVSATDDDGGTSKPFTMLTQVVWTFDGFFSPVNNLPATNIAKAGSAIPLKFSLDGDQGMNIFAAGFPVSAATSCNGSVGIEVEETETAGASELRYDAGSDQYHYVWKTDRAWAGTCRQLIVKLRDGTEHRANFQFR